MRIVVTGATGNVGTSVLKALANEPSVDEVLGLARRVPKLGFAKTTFASADVTHTDLRPFFKGAAAVVHLAWRIQPSHDPRTLTMTNVQGSRRVFEAVAAAGVPALVYASSVGAYSPGGKERLVDESWPVGGIHTSLYSRHKAEVERLLDQLERESSSLRVVRMRPALIFKRDAASEIHRLFAGPLTPKLAFDPRVLRAVPAHPQLVFQCVHSLDVGEAYARAVTREVRGAFNIATPPPIDSQTLARTLQARPITVSRDLLRRAVDIAWRLRLVPIDPGWVDLAFESPLMSIERAQRELEWEPRHGAIDTLRELVDGLRHGRGVQTPPLVPRGRPASQAVAHGTAHQASA